jgi:hypothetical protein
MVSLYKNILSEQAIDTTYINKKIKENGKEKRIKQYNYVFNLDYFKNMIIILIKLKFIKGNTDKYNNYLINLLNINGLYEEHNPDKNTIFSNIEDEDKNSDDETIRERPEDPQYDINTDSEEEK